MTNYDRAIVNRVLEQLPASANCYLYGSRVYGTHDHLSDHDFHIVVFGKDYAATKLKLESLNKRVIDIHLHNLSDFQDAIDEHKLYALECLSLPSEFVFKQHFDFEHIINHAKLRSVVSAASSNSWVKAKKKLLVLADRDERIAIKSLYHSMRILDFGIQLALTGGIYDFTGQDHILSKTRLIGPDWHELELAFKQDRNQLATEFKKVCSK